MLDVSKASYGVQMLAPEDPEEEPDEPVRGADAIIRAQMVCIHGLTRLITARLHSQISAKRATCDARLQVRPCAWLCHMDGYGLLWALLLCQHHCESSRAASNGADCKCLQEARKAARRSGAGLSAAVQVTYIPLVLGHV